MATMNSPRMKDNNRNRGVPRSAASSLVSKTEPTGRRTNSTVNYTDENHESVIFIWFDPQEQMNMNFIAQLRAINDNVQAFTDAASCFDTMRSSKEKIFFISSSSNNELISTVHDFTGVEGIFILDSNMDRIKGDFPKLFGIFIQQEELFRILREVFDAFEQIQLEDFAFEEEKIFLWSQLWKEDLINRKVSSNKEGFIDMARHHYRENARIIELITEFEKSYRPADVINWCLRSPFPTRFLLYALRSHTKTQLNICRFLFVDASRYFQQNPKRKSSDQVYRGMKLSNQLLDKFEAHVGQLICTSGFFPCTKSRTNALALASLPTYRSDLLPVLFKIDCDASSLFTELANKNSSPVIAFDVCLAFRVVYINRGPMSVIKMKTAGDAGRKIALEYLGKHKDETLQSLMDELLRPPKPPTPPPPPPPPPRIPTPPPAQIKDTSNSVLTSEETKAQKYVQKGEIDLAIVTYQRIKPPTARVLNAMGQLCAEKKGDYDYALQCHKQALVMQEEAGEATSDTLTYLGNVYHNRREFDLALDHHTRALELRESNSTAESSATVSNLLGIANARWARREHSEAITNAEKALTLQEALVPPNEICVATTLALLGKIYQDTGDSTHALELCTKALAIFERTVPVYCPILAELVYQIGTIQSSLDALTDAQQSFERSVKIYRRLVPRGHPDRTLAENEYRRVIQLIQTNKQNSQINS